MEKKKDKQKVMIMIIGFISAGVITLTIKELWFQILGSV